MAVRTATGRGRETGFTYLGVLLLVAIMSAALAGTATVWHTLSQRDKERDLLFVGNEYRKAIGLYYERTPGGAKQFPKKLEDLLQDKRQPHLSRYLRRLYADPMNGSHEWGLIKGQGDAIMGVYSLAEGAPIKTGNFDEVDKDFAGKSSYAEWKFVYQPKQGMNSPSPVPGQPGAPGPGVAPAAPIAAGAPVPQPQH